MENTTKAILIGVGLFITIALISAVLVIMGVGNNLIKDSSDNLNGIASALQQGQTEAFDDKTVTGSEVIACIREYYNSTKLTITLNNTASAANSIIVNNNAATSRGMQVGAFQIPAQGALAGTNTRFDLSAAPNAAIAAGTKIPLSWLSDSSKGIYVKPQSLYHANLITSNGDVIGVAFTKAI